MAIPLTNITIPTPAAYDAVDPTKQQENFYYVLNQILTAAKTAEESIDVNQSALTDAVADLTFSGERLEIPALGLMLQKLGKSLAIYEA